ncbi:small conductance mechanosensitive channel [Tenacibaculum skagerrakense]|uniref:Small conductance mechanosensitive channel n=1 Tax=Tenacibaculum skagerrakense TaxID=186571 RepID=A0A4R2P373_9FLAO|nr:mechanosensitive ion channel domain-containing protein [Tenacibaculum skagerrakense]TCP28175.1 small conductance mechanosensitive channel [Tenacibaculum skagerrakense]
MEEYILEFKEILIQYAPKVIAAFILLIIGLWVVKLITRAIDKVMDKRNIETSLQGFLISLMDWTLKIFLFVTIAGQLGLETTSFAAIIAAAGLAVGMALQGSLSNFAGGALIMIFRPFKVGDYIEAQGHQGSVKEIQIFTTKLNTPDNKEVILPNGALSNGAITNYSSEDKRRVDITFGVSYDADIKETKDVLYNVINNTPFTLEEPATQVVLAELADSSINFKTRTWVNSSDYWNAYFHIIENTKIALDKAGIEIPYPHSVEIQKEG